MNMVIRNFMLICVSTFLQLAGINAVEGAQASKCLQCHSDVSITGNAKGYLYVDPIKFAGTTHSLIGCESCHDKVSSSHPTDGAKPSRPACKDCHAAIKEEYSKSLHGTKAACVDCHNPHEVKAFTEVSGRDINAQCAKCHDIGKTVASHNKWLPQGDLHIDVLPCITCHTSSKDYVITLYIEQRVTGEKDGGFRLATFKELSQLAGNKGVESLIDTNGDKFISIDELRKFNKDDKYSGKRLLGMMIPEVITHSYQILQNRRDCSFCHASGPSAMQTSYVAFPDSNGKYSKLSVEKGAVLDLLYGTPDFYMMGTTRSTTLSILGGLIILGGLMMPVGHGTLRYLTRKNRKEKR